MFVCSLGSGSRGNCICLWGEERGSGVLIDCGLSYRQIRVRMSARGINPDWFGTVLLSHKHVSDHARGLKLWLERHGGLVYCTSETALGTPAAIEHPRQHFIIGCSDTFQAGEFTVQTAPLVHNAAGACTFAVTDADGSRFALLYETGRITPELAGLAAGAHALGIEFNHDRTMLEQNPKLPIEIMERVAVTHLSNSAAARYLSTLGPATRLVILLHLSRPQGTLGTDGYSPGNNTPELAMDAARASLSAAGSSARLVLAEQDQPSEVFEIHANQEVA